MPRNAVVLLYSAAQLANPRFGNYSSESMQKEATQYVANKFQRQHVTKLKYVFTSFMDEIVS